MEKLLLGETGKVLGFGLSLLLLSLLASLFYVKITFANKINNLAKEVRGIKKTMESFVSSDVVDLKLELVVTKLDAIDAKLSEDMKEIKQQLIKLNGRK